ncbi:MAG: ribonuclease [Chlamydiales bacterium]|jgi:ribonuclease HIII|nr:ribonuclease [Chlamydiales bacterium]
MSPFVTEIDPSLASKLEEDLIGQGFSLAKPAYTRFQAKKKGISCTLYLSGKLVVQGSEMKEFIEFYLEPEILKTFAFSSPAVIDERERIGTDEAGKGDFFGPLCVAGVFASKEAIHTLSKAGIADSKTLSDSKVEKLAAIVERETLWHVIVLNPAKYNELYRRFNNLNYMLAWAHAAVIHTLHQKSGCPDVIVDQFAKEFVLERFLKEPALKVVQRTKAESDVVVAAASILARNAFVKHLKILGDKYQIELPKGASDRTRTMGQKLYNQYGADILKDVSKEHFKTFSEIVLCSNN